MTISELISSIRGMNRLINADNRLSDRFIYNEAVSIKNLLLKQESNKNRLFGSPTLFKTIKKLDLISVDTIEACDINSDCIIKRSKDRLPTIVESSGGYLVRSITSLDGSTSVFLTTDLAVARKSNIQDKHASKEPLSFIRDNYLYLVNVPWPFVRIEAIFESPDEIDSLNACDTEDEISCTAAFDQAFAIPNYLEDPLKKLLNEALLRYYHQLREDMQINKATT